MKNALTPLAKSMLVPLTLLIATLLVDAGIHKKKLGSKAFGSRASRSGTTTIISNELYEKNK